MWLSYQWNGEVDFECSCPTNRTVRLTLNVVVLPVEW